MLFLIAIGETFQGEEASEAPKEETEAETAAEVRHWVVSSFGSSYDILKDVNVQCKLQAYCEPLPIQRLVRKYDKIKICSTELLNGSLSLKKSYNELL